MNELLYGVLLAIGGVACIFALTWGISMLHDWYVDWMRDDDA